MISHYVHAVSVFIRCAHNLLGFFSVCWVCFVGRMCLHLPLLMNIGMWMNATIIGVCFTHCTHMRSGLFKWGGDAHAYDRDDQPYIEMVTSPNNPDDGLRGPVVNKTMACWFMTLHTIGLSWRPSRSLQITTSCFSPRPNAPDTRGQGSGRWFNYNALVFLQRSDLLLICFYIYVVSFIFHFWCMWRWAIVKDSHVAKLMVKFLEISTIGVSKEAQLRAISILEMISTNSCPTNFFKSPTSLLDSGGSRPRKWWGQKFNI